MQAPLWGERQKMNETNIRPLPRMRTIKQTAAETGVAEYFVRRLVKQDKIKYVQAGRKVLINLDLFIDFLNGGEQE